MKTTHIFLFAFALLVTAPFQADAQKRKAGKQITKSAATTKTVRGAASVAELGQYVYAALTENNFDAISQYFPTETDLNLTGNRTPDEDLKLILEDQTPAKIQATFRADFDDLQNKSIEQGVSFTDIKLMEVQAGTAQKANRLMPVNLFLSHPSNETLVLVFETLKINGRFFLFQHIGTKSEAN